MNKGLLIKHNVDTVHGYPATLVAIKEEDEVFISSAICNLDAGDVYTKKEGVSEAKKKFMEGKGVQRNICNDDFQEFLSRCLRYFQEVPYAKYHW